MGKRKSENKNQIKSKRSFQRKSMQLLYSWFIYCFKFFTIFSAISHSIRSSRSVCKTINPMVQLTNILNDEIKTNCMRWHHRSRLVELKIPRSQKINWAISNALLFFLLKLFICFLFSSGKNALLSETKISIFNLKSIFQTFSSVSINARESHVPDCGGISFWMIHTRCTLRSQLSHII